MEETLYYLKQLSRKAEKLFIMLSKFKKNVIFSA